MVPNINTSRIKNDAIIENQRDVICSKLYSFNKYLCDTCNIPSSVLGTGDTTIKRTKKKLCRLFFAPVQHGTGGSTGGESTGGPVRDRNS